MSHPHDTQGRMGPEQRRQWMRLVLSYDRKVLTGAQKTVLVALEMYADYRDGTNAYPGEENLAADTGLTTRAVRDAMKRARDIGLIVRTALENPKAGKAAVYRLAMPSTTGTTVPVDNHTMGTTVPVETATTGTTTHHHRNSHVATTGTVVPPTLPAPSNHQLVESDWGTSPASVVPVAHTNSAPSRFCDAHPMGTRNRCPDCGNARTAFEAWRAACAENDVAIAQAQDFDRRTRRQLIEACQAAGGACDDFGRVPEDPEADSWNTRLIDCEHPKIRRVENAS